MVLHCIALYSISLQGIECNFVILYGIACHCIVFDFNALYCMLFHWIVCYYIVLYFIRFHCMLLRVISLYCMVLLGIVFFCTVSHCHVPLLQRAGELPRSASSHFLSNRMHRFIYMKGGLPAYWCWLAGFVLPAKVPALLIELLRLSLF